MINLKGSLARITYRNTDNHYTVCRINAGSAGEGITVVGHMPGVAEGETLHLQGKWVTHPKYGDQFQVETYEVILPATSEGIRKYLGSGIVKGIGRSMADRIVDFFEDRTLDIIENEPDRLCEVQGIGKAKMETVRNAWNRHHSVRRVMQYLQKHEVGVYYASMIIRIYGDQSLDILENEPYLIARDMAGPGFRIADAIALNNGTAEDDPQRLKACLLSNLFWMEDQGNVYSLRDELLEKSARAADVAPDRLIQALEDLETQEEVVIEGESVECVYSKQMHRAEKGIADRIRGMGTLPAPGINPDASEISAEVASRLAIKLSENQLEVVNNALKERIVVITGGPGTGKTTLIRALCAVYKKRNKKVVLSAPTGRAARRISEVTGENAATLHKLLEYDPDDGFFGRNHSNPLDLDVFIVDEASMVDTRLMYHVMKALPLNAVLILVGDTYQLPSVGPGNVLSDIIESGFVQSFFLTEIFRQARESPIVMNAHSVRNGEMPSLDRPEDETPSEFYFIECNDSQRLVETILALCSKRIRQAFPHIDDIQVLTPMHKGNAGTVNLNRMLQSTLNSAAGGIENKGSTFKPGDKVMHLKNNYEKDVFNGDIGTVVEAAKAEGRVSVDYYGRIVDYDAGELDDLTLAYTISVHKSQGSEYSAVIVALNSSHYPLLQRNLLYTAITRGKDLVILVGQKKALAAALANNKSRMRRSGLRHRLAGSLNIS
ncbi:MAG: ATP-dependent RecD-like DNA helicase [Desulfarculaceae bacterium]|nr:ATP-dependent RecD-like DNA helicase [Desulfarculaceae bacterium]